MRFANALIAIACVAPIAACSVPSSESRSPAAQVPTHVLTLSEAGTITQAEQGDFIEIRLGSEPPWRFAGQSGDARAEALGEIRPGVFRFRALAVGHLELTFTAEGERKVTYNFTVR